MRTRFAPVVSRHVTAEDGEGAAHQADGAVGVSAGAPTVHLAESALQPRHETRIGLSAGEKSKVVGNSGKPEDAWPALTGALTGEVAGDTRRLGHSTGVLSEDGDDPDAGGGTDGAERYGRIGRVEVFGSDPVPAVAPDEEGLSRLRRGSRARDLPERSPTVDLDHPGLCHGTAEGDERRPGFLDHATGQEPHRGRAGR